jgi:hypothetical protein
MSNVHALQLLVISNTAWDGSSDKAAERREDAVVQYCNATKEVRAFSCFFNFFTGAGRSGIRNILLSFSKSVTVIYLDLTVRLLFIHIYIRRTVLYVQ